MTVTKNGFRLSRVVNNLGFFWYTSNVKIKGFVDTIKWYNKNARQYADFTYKPIVSDVIQRFIKLLPKNAHVIDAGCGAGGDCKIFQGLGIYVVGLDISKGLLKEAKKRNPRINFVEGDFLQLPFDNNSFDGVWAHASLVHLETEDEVRKAIEEFNRVLKIGGILCIQVKAQTGKEKTAIASDSLSNHKRFFRYYTEDYLKQLLMSNEFELIVVERNEDIHGRKDVKWISLFAKKGNVPS